MHSEELVSYWSRVVPTTHLKAAGMGSSHIYQPVPVPNWEFYFNCRDRRWYFKYQKGLGLMTGLTLLSTEQFPLGLENGPLEQSLILLIP